jgi:hypothetical protein
MLFRLTIACWIAGRSFVITSIKSVVLEHRPFYIQQDIAPERMQRRPIFELWRGIEMKHLLFGRDFAGSASLDDLPGSGRSTNH